METYEPELIIKAILDARDRIAKLLGAAWPKFSDEMERLLREIEMAQGDFKQLWIDELLALGLRSPAADIFREIMAKATLEDSNTRSVPTYSWNEAYAISPTEPSEPDRAPPRYLNAGLFSEAGLLSSDVAAMLHGGPYRLGVNVGKFWGPGRVGAPIPDHLLQPFFETDAVLELDVAARSLEAAIAPASAKLHLPREGDSPLVFFDVHLTRVGRQAIDVDLIFRGHLLQSRRLEVEVIAAVGAVLPESAWPVQDGYITFTRTAALEPDALSELGDKPPRLTIVAERELDGQRIGLRFYDNTGVDLGFQQSTLTNDNLAGVMQAARAQLAATMNAYTGTIGSTREVLTKHLGQLAEVGRSFYLALLPGLAGAANVRDTGQQLNIKLAAGATIQVAPLSPQLSVPWELLYERRIESYAERTTRLCPTFRDHGPAPIDCPAYGDPTVVCPHGFWGYRYIVEQLPCRVDPGQPPPLADLPLWIRNTLPLRLQACVYAGFKQLKPHLDHLRALAPQPPLEFISIDSKDGVRAALSNVDSPADVLYFYTHGSLHLGAPCLIVGADERIKYVDLDAWDVRLDHHPPLVVLNACDSADYSPESFENLLKFFCDRGAAGVIGTQCEIKETLADFVSIAFFRAFFLQQASAGQALLEARRALLRDHLDPRGLAYSLFASADLKLAQSID